jgi:cell division septal protein FtsQ
MVKEENKKSIRSEYSNFKIVMILNWISFILASISLLILIITIYKHIKINQKRKIFVVMIGCVFYSISLILSIIGLVKESRILSLSTADYENALEQQKKYQPHFISLLILTIISVISVIGVSVYI